LEHWHKGYNKTPFYPNLSKHVQLSIYLWGNFLSFYSRFYEVIIFESTCATSEGKNCKCIHRC
jgi:hypothetical protein